MYILHPKTRNRIFLDNGISDYETRKAEVLKKVLTDDVIEYCQQNAIIKNARQEVSHEMAERILENCATYLLMGEFSKNNIMTIYNIRKAQVMEIPASASDSNAEDLMYSANFSDENAEKGLTASTEIKYDNDISDIKDEQQMPLNEIAKKEKRKANKRALYRDSRAYRMEKLYTTRKLMTYRIKQKFYIDENGKRRPEKNIFGQPVFEAVYAAIGGNVGVIDEKNKYKSKWCLVDTDNIFCYNGITLKIDESVKQYEVQEDNKSKMDKILVIPVDGKLIFFDQDIVRIPDDRVRQN